MVFPVATKLKLEPWQVPILRVVRKTEKCFLRQKIALHYKKYRAHEISEPILREPKTGMWSPQIDSCSTQRKTSTRPKKDSQTAGPGKRAIWSDDMERTLIGGPLMEVRLDES